MSADERVQFVVVVLFFAAAFIGGIGYGVALGATWERRMSKWAATVVAARRNTTEEA